MKKYMDALEEMNTEAVEYVRGIPVVKVFQQTVFSFKSFYGSIFRYKELVIQYLLSKENPSSIYLVVINGFAYFLVPVAILMIADSGDFSSVLLNLFLYILVTPIFGINIMRSLSLGYALRQAGEAVDRLEALTDVGPLPEVLIPKTITGHEIEYREVSFSYPGCEQKAIDRISFTLPAGKTFALVGCSGGGKTTIARLVPRFWDADAGTIFIGGTDVKEIASEELMRNISFVFQNTRLFKTSLLENIRYGNPRADEQDIERVVQLAQCREIIDKLPQGLNTLIGTTGVFLSGGEQQRIALARAILKDAPIVILDEATAFTDPENEHLIQQALGVLTQGKTVLIIAHRLSSVVNVDSILVVENGRIAEQGNHEELLDKQGLYARMWHEYQQSVQWRIGGAL